MPVARTRQIEREVAGLVARDELGGHALRVETIQRLRRVVPCDAWCASSVDPETLTPTGVAVDNVERELSPVVYRIEREGRDVCREADLAAAAVPASTLAQETGGERARSERYREVLAPMGVGDELRVAARANGVTWGFLHLFRGADRPAFDAGEVAAAARVAAHLARGLRAAALRPVVEAVPAGEVPALVLLDPAGRTIEATPGATERLALLRDPDDDTGGTPEVLVNLAVSARVLAPRGEAARARVPGSDGRWHVVDATCTDRDRVAVVVRSATAADVLGVKLSSLGLSPGEREVVRLALDGRSTKEMAADLHISPHTVQDRLRGVFDKAGVRSRRDLVARLSAGASA